MPSVHGTMNPLTSKAHVYVDALLKPVAVGSPEAAFVYKKADLERVKARRHELGLDKHDEALRAQLASQQVEAAKAEAKAAAAKAEADTIRASAKAFADAFVAATKAPAASAAPAATADVEALMASNREELDAQAKKAGVEDPESLPNKRAVAEAIVAKSAAS